MDLFSLLVLLFVIAVLIAVIAMPILALIFSVASRKRISRLEARLDRLEALLPPQTSPAPEPVTPTPEPAPEPPPATTPQPAFSLDKIESMIGRRWLGWIAISLILFATAFFLKYAFDNRWIDEVGQVGIGIVFGIAMSAGGFRYHQRGWRIFSQILMAGGIILLYLSTYAAFGYYNLIGQRTAFVYFVILITEAGALALVYNAPAIAIMALVGGFLTPLLLHSGRDQYRSLFTYIVTLDVGALALLKHWRGLSSVAYFGTQFLFWIWYNQNYHHQKRAAVLAFQTAVFLIFLMGHLGRALVRWYPATTEDAVLLLVNPFVYFATAYHLLNSTHHHWMGAFAIGMALLYAAAARILMSRVPTSRREALLLIAVALTFASVAIPIQLQSNWITIAWAVVGLAILWAALEMQSARLRAHAFVLFGLAFLRLLIWDTPAGPRPSFIPIFNRYFLSSLLVIACFLGAIYLYERARARNTIESQVPRLVIGLAAAIAFWFVISVETHTYFTARALAEREPADAEHQRWLGQMALSVVWATYAGALAALGFIRRAGPVRWASLVLFALTIIKAMLVDIAQLQQLYRIIVFFVLGTLLLLVAWAYHKAFHSRESATHSQRG